MTKTTLNDQVIHFVVKLPKKQSAFAYTLLESNEGLCFFSTLDVPPDFNIAGPEDCLLDLKGHSSLEKEIRHLIEQLQLNCQMQILQEERIPAQKGRES